MAVRVRYAPSPTGEPHVGNIRTALFDWLIARRTGGQFILRIEDTDQNRLVPGAVESIMSSLRWLGLDWDEGPGVGGSYGPYVQSERLAHYQEAAHRLVAQGDAYRCYCSPERLDQVRAEQVRRKKPPRYDRECRNLSEADRAAVEAQSIPPVVRFRTPLDGQTGYHDLLRGDLVVENATLDDFVILKSDGFPTYHLAVVVDDHLMEISHVLRGDEWLPSAPRHMLLHQALGLEAPVYVHLPLILGPDRSKLSKRHGDTAVSEYRDRGYLPEALINFLALIGWAYDEKTEFFSREELVEAFSLEHLGKTPGVFNLDKLDWMNGMYIRRLAPEDLAARLLPFLERDLPPQISRPFDAAYVASIVPLIQERLKRLGEAAELTDFFFAEDLSYEPQLLLGRDLSPDVAGQVLDVTVRAVEKLLAWDAAALEGAIRPLAEELGLKTGPYFGVLRVASTGKTAAPPLFQTLEVLGLDRTLRRFVEARQALAQITA